MASRYEETKREINDGTERIRALVREGNHDAARDLTAEVAQLILGLPKNQQRQYKDALNEAATPKEPENAPAVHSWRDHEGAEAQAKATAEAMADGVRYHMKGAKRARKMAELALQLRLLIPNRGLPDLLCWSQDAREAQSEVYSMAGRQVEGTDEERETALEALMQSVRTQMMNVLTPFIRSLDEDPDKARTYFAPALEQFPDLSPTEAVYAAYEAAEMPLPRHTDLEKRAMRRQIKEAKILGEIDKVNELEIALGVKISTDPVETLSTNVAKLRKDVAATEKLLPTIPNISDDAKSELRDQARKLRDVAEKVLEATL